MFSLLIHCRASPVASPTLAHWLFFLIEPLIYSMAVIITTNHLGFIKEMEYTENTPKIEVQALILQDL